MNHKMYTSLSASAERVHDSFANAREWWQKASVKDRVDLFRSRGYGADYVGLDFDNLPFAFRTIVRDGHP